MPVAIVKKMKYFYLFSLVRNLLYGITKKLFSKNYL